MPTDSFCHFTPKRQGQYFADAKPSREQKRECAQDEALTLIACDASEHPTYSKDGLFGGHLRLARFLPFERVPLKIFLSRRPEGRFDGRDYSAVGRGGQNIDHALQHCALLVCSSCSPALKHLLLSLEQVFFTKFSPREGRLT